MKAWYAPSNRRDRRVSTAIFAAGVAIVFYGAGATLLPTSGCVDSTASCTPRPGLGVLTAFIATLVWLAGAWIWERRRGDPGDRGVAPWYQRFLLYGMLLVLAVVVTFLLGTSHYDATYCDYDGFDGECDLGPAEGIVWSFGAVLLTGFGAAAYEAQLLRRRYRGRMEARTAS